MNFLIKYLVESYFHKLGKCKLLVDQDKSVKSIECVGHGI